MATDISIVDVPTLVTAVLTILLSVGGVAGAVVFRNFKGEALSILADIADILVGVGQLIITIAKAGEDEKLSTEEWTAIKEQAREIQADLLRMQGKLGSAGGIFSKMK